jgi:hypothetical protein
MLCLIHIRTLTEDASLSGGCSLSLGEYKTPCQVLFSYCLSLKFKEVSALETVGNTQIRSDRPRRF